MRSEPVLMRSFHLMPDEEVEALPQPELLAGPLVVGTLATLTGAPGHGKTFVALDLALSVASGQPWLGFPVKRGPVVYVVAEGGAGIGVRVRGWKRHYGVEGHVGVYFLMGALNLLLSKEVTGFLTSLSALAAKPVLIVFDTLARCTAGADENLARDMGYVVAALDRIRSETGATMLVLHHPPKKGKGARGSSALPGAADTMLSVRRSIDCTLTLACEKQKDAAHFVSREMELLKVTLPTGETTCVVQADAAPAGSVGTTSQGRLSQAEQSALDALGRLDADGAGYSDWHKESGQPETSFRRNIGALTGQGYVEKSGEGRGTRYILTEKGQDDRQHRQLTATGGHGGDDHTNRHPPPPPLKGGGDGGDDGKEEAESNERSPEYQRAADVPRVAT